MLEAVLVAVQEVTLTTPSSYAPCTHAAYQWISRVTPLSLLMVSRTIDGASFIPK